MKKFGKWTVAVIIALLCVMMVGVASAEIVASGTCSKNVTWVLEGDGTLTISGKGAIQDTLSGEPTPWFDYNEKIKSVSIADGITRIGDRAFSFCENMTRVTIPSSVTSFGEYAFFDCFNLVGVAIPSSVTSIGGGAFFQCESMTSVTIPFGVTRIEESTFSGCRNLTSVSIPSSVTYIGDHAFGDCRGLTSLPNLTNVKTFGEYAFVMCTGLTDITIPSSVTSISKGCFSSCIGLTSVTIPSSVTILGEEAFRGCKLLKNLTIPASVTTIGEHAFGYTLKVYYDEDRGDVREYIPYDDITITGERGSAAETYAKENSITFIPVDSTPAQLATPKLSSVTNTAKGVTIKWSKVKNAENYRVYYKTTGGWKKIADTTNTSYTWTKAQSGMKYTFTVKCMSADGKTATSEYDKTGKSITYFATPKLSSVTNAATGITIKWGKVTGAAQYRVYYKTTGSWKKLTDTKSTSYTWKKAKSGTKYSFTVQSLSSTGKIVSAYDTTGKSITYLAQPKLSSVTQTTKGVTIKWGKVTGAAKYRVYYKTTGGWKKLTETAKTSYTWTKGKSGTKYTFTVCSLSSTGKTASTYDTKGKSITIR